MKNLYLIVLCLCNLSSFSPITPLEIKLDMGGRETCDLGLSDFVESIEYIPLETKDECVIGQGMRFDVDETHIIVKYNDCKSAYLFDRKGHFLRAIGNIGEGPEEFIDIHNVFLESDKNHIVIIGPEKALCFDEQGLFLWSTPFPIDDRHIVAYFQKQFLRAAESYVFRDSTYNVYQIYNQKGCLVKEAITSIPIPLKKDPNWRLSYKWKDITSAYTYQNMLHVREYLNDTVYVINELNQFIPKYILNLGDYKVTPEIQSDIVHFEERAQNKFFIQDIIEMPDGLLMRFFHDWNMQSGYYDKKKGKFYKFKSNGYPNDYDGGMDFTISTGPIIQKNRFVYTAFDASRFISFLEEKKPDNRKIKGPKSAVDAFKKLAKKVDEEDNPIIMIMKLKE